MSSSMTNVISKLNGKHIDVVGVERHFLNDLLHREDGPAIIYPSGYKRWFLHGKCHRKDGPAVEYADGAKAWYLNDSLHREDGPAIERISGCKEWYYRGNLIDCKDNQEFLRLVKLIAFY